MLSLLSLFRRRLFFNSRFCAAVSLFPLFFFLHSGYYREDYDQGFCLCTAKKAEIRYLDNSNELLPLEGIPLAIKDEAGKIFIKEFPPSTITPSQLKGFIKKFEECESLITSLNSEKICAKNLLFVGNFYGFLYVYDIDENKLVQKKNIV